MTTHRVLVLWVLIGTLAACVNPPATPEPPTLTPAPTASATPAPTVVMALSPLTSPQAQKTSAAFLAQELSKLTGLQIVVTLPRNYTTLIEALGQNTVQVGWLPPFAYVAAHEQGYANAGLATLQAGATKRGVQFMANADWLAANAIRSTLPLTTAAELTATVEPSATPLSGAPATATPTAVDDLTALRQLAGKKPCWVEPTSTSGYLIPLGILKLADIATPTGTFLNTSGEVVRTLYDDPAGETCDFGATFIDARQGVSFPDLNQRVRIIYFSAPIIPFDTVAFAADLPAAQREAITAALLALADTEAGQRALKDVYDVDGLTRSDDSFYNAFRLYVDAAGVDPAELIE